MNDLEKGMFEFAYDLTRSAGEKILSCKNIDIEITEKTSQMDIVTQYDILIEKYITEEIAGKYPDHTFIAEECHKSGSMDKGGYIWILDPIDGTTNFYRFARDYSVSLALYHGEEPVFGLIYDVANGLMYSAGKGEAPAINKCRLMSSRNRRHTLDKAVIGMSIRTIRELSNMGTDIISLLSKGQGHRYLGCASLELCRIATGEYDLFLSTNVHIWDIAAARIFIEQSGGFLFSHTRNTKSSCHDKLFTVAYRCPKLWEETLELLPPDVKCAFGL